jgi:hypothetical protein
MASFSFSRPADNDRPSYAQIRRCTPTSPLRGVAISEYLGADLHWLNGRSSPHIEPQTDCPGCTEKRPRRWEGYLWLWEPQTSAIRIAAFPPGPLTEFDAYIAAHGTLRAATVELAKPGGKPSSRVRARLTRSTYGLDQIPSPPATLEEALLHIWGLHKLDVEVKDLPTRQPACKLVKDPQPPTTDIEDWEDTLRQAEAAGVFNDIDAWWQSMGGSVDVLQGLSGAIAEDQFEGKPRKGVRTIDAKGLMLSAIADKKRESEGTTA